MTIPYSLTSSASAFSVEAEYDIPAMKPRKHTITT